MPIGEFASNMLTAFEFFNLYLISEICFRKAEFLSYSWSLGHDQINFFRH